jgi:hypothetical protein
MKSCFDYFPAKGKMVGKAKSTAWNNCFQAKGKVRPWGLFLYALLKYGKKYPPGPTGLNDKGCVSDGQVSRMHA